MNKTETVKLSDLMKFSEKQMLATKMADEFRFVLYGGAAGGGKSYWLRWYPIRWLMKTFKETGVPGVVAGLFCEDYPALKDRHLGKMQNEFPPWLGKLSESTVSGLSFKLNPEYGGGVLALRNLDDPSRYFSSEFALIAVDELTKNRKETFDFLRMRNRWAVREGVPKIRTKFIAGTNPGGVGHDWVKKIWIDRVFDDTELEKDQFVYVPATVYDNPYLDDGYVRSLRSLSGRLQKAYLEGNWDLFEGQYFSEWSPTHHVCEPFTIPDGWKRYRSYDHGREAPAACGWYAVDFDGRVWKYREYYKAGQNIDAIASEINRLSEGEHYEYSVADPSIFSHSGFVDKSGGQTIAESFANHGIMFIPASNRRIDGWSIMHSYLAWSDEDPQKGTPLTHPRLIFFKTCYNSIRTIPSLIHDEHNPEDLKSRSEDHCADECRYLLTSLHETRSQRPLTGIEKKLHDMYHREEDFNTRYYGK